MKIYSILLLLILSTSPIVAAEGLLACGACCNACAQLGDTCPSSSSEPKRRPQIREPLIPRMNREYVQEIDYSGAKVITTVGANTTSVELDLLQEENDTVFVNNNHLWGKHRDLAAVRALPSAGQQKGGELTLVHFKADGHRVFDVQALPAVSIITINKVKKFGRKPLEQKE